LLDTNAMLWAMGELPRLRPATSAALRDPDNEVRVSSASVWEAAIKVAKGKLALTFDLARGLEETRLQPLPITHRHALAASALPRHHDDPFDRMLVAQAQLEGLTLVTTDRALAAYDVAVLPA
jgi:PIN domain nuclease of toxin-antitoxin system